MARRDGDAMARCYHPDATFEDPAFGLLRGPEVGAMWQMLCKRGKDLQVRLVTSSTETQRGSAKWEADYTFSQTGKRVHNVIDSRFVLRDGLIVEQRDSFDFHHWLGMALGTPGKLLGWLPPLQALMRNKARKTLHGYMRRA